MRAGFLFIILAFLASLGYVVWHLWRITPGGWPARLVVTGLFLLWMILSFASMGLSEKVSVRMASVMADVGYPWMIAFLYLLIVFVLADILSLCKILPKAFLTGNLAGLLGVIGIVALVLLSGGIHYRHKQREELTIHTDKPLGKPLTVVLASDLHVGYGNRRAELSRWIDLINAEHPDLVLFGGDIVDMRLRPILEGGYAGEFRRLEAPAFAVLGNHEYYGNEKDAERFYADAGITLLRDSVARFMGMDVIGRDDRTNRERKALSDLAVPQRDFTILLDHQPSHLEEAEEAGVDFQFSGHTHHGQVWPLSWVTDVLFEKAHGYHSRGGTQYYVSSGLGIWGPKIRFGTRSEYLVLHIESGSYTRPAELLGPDGPMELTATYYPSPSDVPGCFGVISHTDGRDVFTSMWLDFYARDDVKPGEELSFEKLSFSAPLSSDSHSYTDSYTGRMILKEKTGDRVVIRMEDVHFSILHGEYTLDGNLPATVKDSEGGD